MISAGTSTPRTASGAFRSPRKPQCSNMRAQGERKRARCYVRHRTETPGPHRDNERIHPPATDTTEPYMKKHLYWFSSLLLAGWATGAHAQDVWAYQVIMPNNDVRIMPKPPRDLT